MRAEQRQLEAEVRNFDRYQFQLVFAAINSGAALFAAGAAVMKLSIA